MLTLAIIFFFFFFLLFRIFICLWLHWVFIAVRLFSSHHEPGLLSLVEALWLPIVVASLVAEHRLWGTRASAVAEHGLSSRSSWTLQHGLSSFSSRA